MHPSEPLPTSHPVHPAEPTDPLDRLARKRAGAKLGWYLHTTLYVLVNVVLALLSSAHGKHWAIFPALGWGLGLLIHGAAVWIALPGGSLHGQLLERERAALRRHWPR